MKKWIVLFVVALMMAAVVLAALPAAPVTAQWLGAPCGAVGGDPPGWSQVSRGEGGSGSPGVGPGAP
jgi:hypothetical protein